MDVRVGLWRKLSAEELMLLNCDVGEASWEICMQVRKQQLELDMELQSGSKQEKKYIKAVYFHSAYLTYM